MVAHSFKLWSQTDSNIKENIDPELGMREWDELWDEDKEKIWLFLKNKDWFTKSKFIYSVINQLNEKYKKKSYGGNTLIHGGPHYKTHPGTYQQYFSSCCKEVSIEDFYNIFLNKYQDVVYELISIYALNCINLDSLEAIGKTDDEIQKKKLMDKAWEIFIRFENDINDIFEQFSINMVLTRNGLVFRQDSKITDDIYQPVLTYLSNTKWKAVNRDLGDAFTEFQKKSPNGYSACITHTVSALQAFMQIIVHGKTGKGKLEGLITQAIKESLIPDDSFSKRIFKDIESVLMEERQKTGNPHPKKEYANEKNAKLLLNLTMVFIQHCIVE